MRGEHRSSVSDAALLAIVGGAAALAGAVWLWGGLAGLLFGDGWPHVAGGQLLTVIVRLPARLTHPAAAWPAAAREVLPGAAGFYAALAVLMAATWLAIVAGSRAGLVGLVLRRPAGARWAGASELRALHGSVLGGRVRHGRAQTGRLALGRCHGRLLYAEQRHALVAFGPPQSGKSAGLAVPALLEWDGPAVASSIKTDLHQATAARRRELGEVLVFDPYGLSPARGTTWSPLRLASSWDGALSTALRMSAAAELDTSNVKGSGYWTAAAEQRLAPLLWAGSRTGGGIAAVVRWAYGQGDAELPRILHALISRAVGDRELADARAAYDAHVAFEALAGETRSSIESTVQMLLRAYRSPRVQASARSCELTPERLVEAPNTLYLIGDSHRSRLLRPIFLALLQEVVDHAFHHATIRGGRLRHPLLLCLDELGNVAPLPNLAEVASSAPSHNIQLVSIFHDLAQAKSRYGEQAQTVINSHRARLLLPGVADLETLRYFSDLLGEQLYREPTRDAQPPLPAQRHPLGAPQELRQLDERQALLIYGRLAPTKLRLRTYYGDRRLRKLAGATEDGR